MRVPEFLGWVGSMVSHETIHPDKMTVEKGRFLNHTSNGVVYDSRGLVERTDPDAGGAVHSVFRPESIALFGVDIPLEGAGMVRHVGTL